MQKTVSLNSVQSDWITATSYDYKFFKYWRDSVKEMDKKTKEIKIMQYLGEEVETPAGMIRVLVGFQKDREHYLVHISGSLSESLEPVIFRQYSQGLCTVTRYDLQVTIKMPESYKAVDLFNEVYGRKKVSFIDSRDRREGVTLATVGIGSRQSDRYVRVYQKKLGDGVIGLRFEVEFKQERARAVVRHICKDLSMKNQILLHEILSCKSRMLESMFYMHVGTDSPFRVRVKQTSVGKTNTWLMDSVLTTLIRQLLDHDADDVLWGAFFSMMRRVARAKFGQDLFLGEIESEV